MKNLLIIILSIFIAVSAFAENEDMVKRKIIILPFVNKNKVAEYNYLSGIIMETVRSVLYETDLYEFTNFTKTDERLSIYNEEDFINIKKAIEIARGLRADIAVTGQYIILEKKIMILIHAIDIFTGELVAITKEEGETGLDLFNLVNRSAKDIYDKIIINFPMMKKAEYDKKMVRIAGIKLTAMTKAGIGLTAGGSTLLIAGLPLLIYDLAGYSSVLSAYKLKYLDTRSSRVYDYYDRSYYIFTGLLLSGIIVSGTGLLLTLAAIPLFVIRIEDSGKKKIAFFLNCEGGSAVSLSGLSLGIKFNL